ncbi:MAG: 2'-5' RNA ligase family protein [Phycisphaerae bacterium]|nr:2'-5' RNA ligase family protein [Phycisphaerae bacterium]
MTYSIELLFDPATMEGIRLTWSKLADTSGSSYMVDNGVYPHVALAVFEADRLPPDLTVLLEQLAAALEPEALRPRGIGRFEVQEPVVFIGFDTCSFLKQVHGRVQTVLDHFGIPNHEYYRSGEWVPHCSVAMKFPSSRLPATLEAAAHHGLTLPFRATEIGLIQHPPTRLLWRRPLTDSCTGP